MTDREILELLLKNQTAMQANIQNLVQGQTELRQNQAKMETTNIRRVK